MNITMDRNVPSLVLQKPAIGHLRAAVDEFLAAVPAEGRVDSGSRPVWRKGLRHLREQVERVRSLVDSSSHCALLKGVPADSVREFKAAVWIIGTMLGDPMVQNSQDHRLIEVYDRGGKTIEEGARYHQTRQGAYVHNDGVSDPLPIDYLVLACGQKAKLGGESILIDALDVHAALLPHPEVLSCLQQDFWFENRGMSEREVLFKAPILSADDSGQPLIRYFRVYIESAHRKASQPLDTTQIEALDVLDVMLDQACVQRRILLEPGDLLVSADDRFLHTRSRFVDRRAPSEAVPDRAALRDVNRYMLRMWMRKSAGPARRAGGML